MRREFLVCYDYGSGGVWAYLSAESRAQVAEQYPELTIIDEPPAWLTNDEDRPIRERMTVDIDDDANEFLLSLRAHR
jgi:hypothetical protein